MPVPGIGLVGDAGRYPTVSTWIISPDVVKAGLVAVNSAPDDHFTAGPHCGVIPSTGGHVGGDVDSPPVGARVVSASGVQIGTDVRDSAPDDHFIAGPYCRVNSSGLGRVGCAGGGPTVRAGIIPPAGVQNAAGALSAPDDHFAASPDCSVVPSGLGCACGAGRYPTVGAWIVSASGVKRIGAIAIPSAPYNHFVAGPHCRVVGSGRRRVDRGGSCPAIGAGIIPPASVQRAAVPSAPYDHLTPCPHCRLNFSGIGCAGGAGWSPRVVDAGARRTGYYWKGVVCVDCRPCHRHSHFAS